MVDDGSMMGDGRDDDDDDDDDDVRGRRRSRGRFRGFDRRERAREDVRRRETSNLCARGGEDDDGVGFETREWEDAGVL